MQHETGPTGATQTHAVVIAGGGPTGLMLAAELALAHVDVVVVERREDQRLAGSRAGGLHARTIEVFDQRGVVDRFLREGKPAQVTGLGPVRFDLGGFPTRHPYGLALWQNRIEHLLAEWVAELSVPILRGREVEGFEQDRHGVDVALSDGSLLRARYLVGCDGGRSLIRKRAGIEFVGWDASTSSLIAEVALAEEPPWGIRRDEKGVYGLGKLDDGPRVRVVLRDEVVTHGEPTVADLRAALVKLYGSDFGVHDVTWLSRFSDATRQAAAYRERRVLLAGDAAHVHSPMGGQGLNLGVQDAFNLGWKLGQVVRGISSESLLDSYHTERHAADARALRATMAAVALSRVDVHVEALGELLAEVLQMEQARTQCAALLSGLDVRYDCGEGHPLLGRRMPDLDLQTARGACRVYSLLHEAKPVLLHLGGDRLDLGAWSPHVRTVEADYAGVWELPVLGVVPAPAAVLLRPDGHVAWAGEGTADGLVAALGRWFGTPS